MRIFTLIATTLFSVNLISQALETEWEFIKSEQSGMNIEGWGVDVDNEGNIYFPINQSVNGQGIDIFCYKLDKDMNELWVSPFHLAAAHDQYSHICDASTEFLYIGGSSCPISGIKCDMAVQKIEKENGGLEWHQTYDFGNNGYDEIDGLEIDHDGIYTSGWAQDVLEGPWQVDVGLWKLNFEGETEWALSHGDTMTSEHQDGHMILEDDRIVATGLWNGTSVTNIFNGKSFLSSYSRENGEILDSVLFNVTTLGEPWVENPLSMTSDGEHYFLTGYSTPENIGDLQLFVAKYDKSFNELWSMTWGGVGGETARSILVHEDKIYVGGYTGSQEYVLNGDGDALLLVLDMEGTVLSYHVWGGDQTDSFRDMARHGESLYLSGFSGTGFSTMESYFANLVKVDIDQLTSNEEISEKFLNVKVFPNPSAEVLFVEIPSAFIHNTELTIYDGNGRVLLSKRLTGEQTRISLDLPPALYTYIVQSAGRSYSGQLVLTD